MVPLEGACEAWKLLLRVVAAERARLPAIAAEIGLSEAQCSCSNTSIRRHRYRCAGWPRRSIATAPTSRASSGGSKRGGSSSAVTDPLGPPREEPGSDRGRPPPAPAASRSSRRAAGGNSRPTAGRADAPANDSSPRVRAGLRAVGGPVDGLAPASRSLLRLQEPVRLPGAAGDGRAGDRGPRPRHCDRAPSLHARHPQLLGRGAARRVGARRGRNTQRPPVAARTLRLHGLPARGGAARPGDPGPAQDLRQLDRTRRISLGGARRPDSAVPRSRLREVLEASARSRERRGDRGGDRRRGRRRGRLRRLPLAGKGGSCTTGCAPKRKRRESSGCRATSSTTSSFGAASASTVSESGWRRPIA